MPELATKADLLAMEQELRVSFSALQTVLRAGFRDLNAKLEILTLQLTIRFGVMWAAAIWFLVIIMKRC